MPKVAEILDKRRANWQQLEQLCARIGSLGRRGMTAEEMSRFASLYRAACADLALADAYQLPPNTVQYLHRLVGRAHNQLYRSRKFDFAVWRQMLLVDAPRRIFHDRCVQFAFVLFWGIFLLTAALGYFDKSFAEDMIGGPALRQLQGNFSEEIGANRDPDANPFMASFYIQHNTSIGLQCFAGSLLILPGIAITIFNSAFLGAIFGYMARPDVPEGENFFHFVTAHGPFELTAIVLSFGAGLRLGMAWLVTAVSPRERAIAAAAAGTMRKWAAPLPTGALSRESSLRRTAVEAMPLMGAAMVMFFLAALIEGFLSPSRLPYEVKAAMAMVSSCLLVFYFVVLGFPRIEYRLPNQSGSE